MACIITRKRTASNKTYLNSDDKWSPIKIDYSKSSRFSTVSPIDKVKLHHGFISKKPWEYECEEWIPVMDTPDTLYYVIELLRLQTKKPYIVIVDTGSTTENFKKIEELCKEDDIELHSLRMKSTVHSSDYPAIAMDLAMSMCRAKYLYCTHADVFLKRKNVLEELLVLCNKEYPVVGYRMTEREHKDWEKMVSHTCTMMHIETMDKINCSWSLRRLCNRQGLEFIANHPKMGNNWPDTEILFNYILWENAYNGFFIGDEKNHEMTNDNRIIHARSLTAGRLYAPEYAKKAQEWVDFAIEESKKNIELWKK